MNQYKYKNQTGFSARFDKQEDRQILDEIELFNNSVFIGKLTQNNINILNVRLQLEHQIKK